MASAELVSTPNPHYIPGLVRKNQPVETEYLLLGIPDFVRNISSG